MITRVNLLWVVAVVAGAFGLYQVKYRVQGLQMQVAETKRELDEERENLHVMQAEWTYLNRPERLQYLTKKYLDLSAIRSRQIAGVESVPFPQKNMAGGPENDPSLIHVTARQAQLRQKLPIADKP